MCATRLSPKTLVVPQTPLGTAKMRESTCMLPRVLSRAPANRMCTLPNGLPHEHDCTKLPHENRMGVARKQLESYEQMSAHPTMPSKDHKHETSGDAIFAD